MATLDFPDVLKPDAEEWALAYNTQTFVSDLNGAQQTAELPGARWRVTMTFTNRTGIDARRLQGFLSGLRGRAGRFYVIPADAEPYGSPAGSPIIAANASAGASSIDTSGWDTAITDLLITGDYFEVNGELKKVTSDASSDGGGLSTIEFAPPLRKDVTTGMQIRYTDPRCVMMLSNDNQATWSFSGPDIYATTIEGMEPLDI